MSRVDEIDERARVASPGPWDASSRDVSGALNSNEGSGLGWEVDGPPEPMLRGEFGRGEDALFIAHARLDVPWLVARVRAVEAVAKELCDESPYYYHHIRESVCLYCEEHEPEHFDDCLIVRARAALARDG